MAPNNEAALLAARKNKEAVELSDLEESIERVVSGPQRKSRIMSDAEKKIVAYHESGHVVVAKLLPNTDPVHKVSIVSRGHALGYTLQLPKEDKQLTSRSEILNRLAVLLGGAAPRSWFSATSPRARLTTCPRLQPTPSGWSRNSA